MLYLLSRCFFWFFLLSPTGCCTAPKPLSPVPLQLFHHLFLLCQKFCFLSFLLCYGIIEFSLVVKLLGFSEFFLCFCPRFCILSFVLCLFCLHFCPCVCLHLFDRFKLLLFGHARKFRRLSSLATLASSLAYDKQRLLVIGVVHVGLDPIHSRLDTFVLCHE